MRVKSFSEEIKDFPHGWSWREERLSDLVNKAGGPTSYAYLRGAKLTRVANASEKKRMSDVVRLMQRQLGEAMIDSLGIRVEDTFTVGIDLEKALSNPILFCVKVM